MVPVIPIVDWDVIVKVTLSAFILLLSFSGLYILLAENTDIHTVLPNSVPTQGVIIRNSTLLAVGYPIIMWIAIRQKRKWRRVQEPQYRNSENLKIAMYSYIGTVWLNIVFNILATNGKPIYYVPLLYAFNQAVLGYFIGIYIDRIAENSHISLKLAGLQAAAQATATVIATMFNPLLSTGDTDFSLRRLGIIGLFSLIQSAASGFIVGILFQHFYNQTIPAKTPTQPILNSGARSVVGVGPIADRH